MVLLCWLCSQLQCTKTNTMFSNSFVKMGWNKGEAFAPESLEIGVDGSVTPSIHIIHQAGLRVKLHDQYNIYTSCSSEYTNNAEV
jgi:hypothetical protein